MESVTSLLESIADVGRDGQRGGYSRPVFSTAELDLRGWFIEQAERRGLDVETDRNGIIWAWWGEPQRGALVTGSHLDSVPGGGAFDGPLGVASALAAVDVLKERGVQPQQAAGRDGLSGGGGFAVRCGVPGLPAAGRGHRPGQSAEPAR